MSVKTGKEFRLDYSADGGTTWKMVGPVNTKDVSLSTPTADVTTQSDSGDYSEFTHSGYSQMTLSLSGIVKQVSGTDSVSGLVMLTYKELSTIANGPIDSRKGYFKISDDLESFEGTFLISEFSRSGGQSDVQEFSMSLQNKGEITHTVAS